jgi:hypothetical protein
MVASIVTTIVRYLLFVSISFLTRPVWLRQVRKPVLIPALILVNIPQSLTFDATIIDCGLFSYIVITPA